MNGKYIVSAALVLSAAVMMAGAYVAAGIVTASGNAHGVGIDGNLGPGECVPAVVAAIAGVAVLVSAIRRDGSPGAVGRCRATRMDGLFLWMTDTTTGHLWQYNGNVNHWDDCGSPPVGK